MRPPYEFVLSIEIFREAVELLHKYFGITLAYFEPEFELLPSFSKYNLESETPFTDTLNNEESITLNGYLYKEDSSLLFDNIKEDDSADAIIIEAIRILLTVLLENRHNDVMEEYSVNMQEEWIYHIVREDMLKLYIYMHEEPFEKMELSIKMSKKSLKLNNYSNWFFTRMATLYLNKYLSDIKSVDQAKDELLTYKSSKGRRHENPTVNIVLYGIYRMFHEQKKMKAKASDALCDMIENFLKLAGLINENEIYVNRAWIRQQIQYISKSENPPKFMERTYEFKSGTLNDLKGVGTTLF